MSGTIDHSVKLALERAKSISTRKASILRLSHQLIDEVGLPKSALELSFLLANCARSIETSIFEGLAKEMRVPIFNKVMERSCDSWSGVVTEIGNDLKKKPSAAPEDTL